MIKVVFSLPEGQTTGSTHIESQLREANASNVTRKTQASTLRDMQPRRRLESDQTVFRIYKGVKTFDFCKEKNVIVTGGEGSKSVDFNLLVLLLLLLLLLFVCLFVLFILFH